MEIVKKCPVEGGARGKLQMKNTNKEFKHFGNGDDEKHADKEKDKKNCSVTKEELLAEIADETPYFEETKDLFDQKIIPVDAQWGDEEGEYDERWGAYIDEKKGLRVGLKTLIERLRADYRFITPIDTEVLHIYQNGVYDPSGEKQIRKLLDGKFGTTAQRQVMAEVLEHLKDASFIRREKINAEKGYLPLFNGILNLETLELEAFDPNKIWTFKIPVWYDKKAKCPKFKKFLKEVFAGAEETIKCIQEQFGYCLYPGMPSQKLIWWIGGGANGKDQLAYCLTSLLGDNNCCAMDLHDIENNRFAVGNLYGKFANILGEPDPRTLEKSNKIKALTGDTPIDSDVKFGGRIKFRNFAKFISYANDYPSITDVTDAFWRRVIAVDFPNTFKEKGKAKEGDRIAIPDIAKKIATQEELSGILNWAIEGLKRLKANNWVFTTTEATMKAKERFMMMANPVNAFITEKCEFDPSAKTATADLYDAYKEFCEEKGIGIESIDRFGKALSRTPRIVKRLVRRSDGKRVNGWAGIRIS